MLPEHLTPHKLRLLAGLLAAPGEGSLEIITELAQTELWLQSAVDQLTNFSLERWQGEHTYLFINGHPKTACPPFESVYRHGIMNGAVCSELASFYQKIGLEPIEEISPDYLGVLLECAAYLAEQQPFPTAWWEELWQHHLARWVPRFARDLQHSELFLYQQLGKQLERLFL
jgi:TorA maturation chaperone TorD